MLRLKNSLLFLFKMEVVWIPDRGIHVNRDNCLFIPNTWALSSWRPADSTSWARHDTLISQSSVAVKTNTSVSAGLETLVLRLLCQLRQREVTRKSAVIMKEDKMPPLVWRREMMEEICLVLTDLWEQALWDLKLTSSKGLFRNIVYYPHTFKSLTCCYRLCLW